MIRFCDKEVYNIVEGDFTRSQLLIFFLEEKTRKFSVIAIFRKDGTFKGIITYRDLIEFEELEKSINPDKIEVSDSFWADARTYFGRSCRKLLTVVDRNENILGFVYNDSHYRYNTLFNMLSAMEKTVLVLPERYQKIKIIIITDLNELAWKCYKIFVKNGFDICVVGEKWEWFGLKSGENYNYYPDFWKFYIYAEGTKCLREENEWGQSCYDDVFDNFLFIYEMGVANSIDIYDKQIRRLLKDGVAICECSIPMNDEIMNKTLYEEFSIACNMDLSDYLEKRKKYTNVQKRCLWNLYGYENIITYRKFGNEREVELVTFRSIYGRTLKGIEFVKRIYLLGPCIVRGYGCLESDSLVAQLQKNVMKFEYQVIAVAIPNGRFDLWRECLKYLPVREKDIILCVNYSDFFGGSVRKCNYIDLKPIYEEKDRESIFCGEPLHTNGKGNQLIAKEIMSRFLTDKIIEMKTKYSNRFLQKGEILNEDVIKSIEYYVNCIKINKGGGKRKTGAIVMNCNPFTNGHLCLIQNAAKKVEDLYIFVVEENRSYFRFEDRFLMVQEGTWALDNVYVVPSGNWVLSYKTFPAYFEKEDIQEVKIDAKFDLEIFARYIAPKLGITKRFAGEEPIDKITRQYNEQMREVLTLFDIEFEEVPRMRIHNEVVSASRARQCILEEKWEELRYLIPESSYKICRERGYFCKKN